MRLSKHHGLGNDFLVALVDEVPVEGAELARSLCHRTLGVGADGLIFGTPATDADLTMTLFNADGSAAEISGNGIRCLAQALAMKRGLGSVELAIATVGGCRKLRLSPGCSRAEVQVSVDMGPVTPGPDLAVNDIVARPTFSVTRAGSGAVGNRHLVIEVDDFAAVDPELDGPAIEARWMPDGMNIHFLRHSGPDEITLVHWERGAGVTQACGSGAVVSAAVAHEWGMVDQGVTVQMPGGSVRVSLGETAVLSGPAVHVADIEVAHG